MKYSYTNKNLYKTLVFGMWRSSVEYQFKKENAGGRARVSEHKDASGEWTRMGFWFEQNCDSEIFG